MAAVLAYARRSDSVLGRLLGQAYNLDDVIFYLGASIGILSLGASKRLESTRLPLAGIFHSLKVYLVLSQ